MAKGKGSKVTKKQQTSKRNRNNGKKGKKWQKGVAEILSAVTGCDVKDFYSTQGGDKGAEDVNRSKAAREAFPFWIECKNTQTLQIPKWWAKLNEDRAEAKCDDPGIIISKLSGTSEALVTMSLTSFVEALYGPLTPHQLYLIKWAIRMKKEPEPK